MRPTIVVDATPIISALIGGFSREILFNHHFNFITTQFTLLEVMRYVPYIAKKSGVSESLVQDLLTLIPLKVYDEEEYKHCLQQANSLIKDKNDVPILALALAKHLPLWSEDQHFESIREIELIKTKDFV